MKTVAVVGAYGHTGRFVVAELVARGYVPLLVGRDSEKLHTFSVETEAEYQVASIEEPESLDSSLRQADAVINCAGPFAATSAPIIRSALRLGMPYVGTAAELEAIDDAFTEFTGEARNAGVSVLPTMGFYGGLGDLLATAAMGDWTAADSAEIAYGLSSWHPTEGTLAAGRVSQQRRGGQSVRFRKGKLEYHSDPSSTQEWTFPEPFGTRTVINELTMADAITFARHSSVPDVRTHMSANAIQDLQTPGISPPLVVDDSGRSAQTFVVDARVRSRGSERRAVARGVDIYAVTAPLTVEAIHRTLTGRIRTKGLAAAGEVFDAADFLRALSSQIEVETFSE